MEQRPQDFKILSEILGHKDVSITLNLYTHVMTEKKVNAMKDVVIRIGWMPLISEWNFTENDIYL